MKLHHGDERVTLWHGDCLEVLRSLADASVDSVVTDPPYGLEFMGREWDSFGTQDVRQRGDGTFTAGDRRHGLVRHGIGGSYGKDSLKSMRKFGEWCELWTAECLRVLKPGGHLLAFGGTRTWHRLTCAVEDAGFEVRDSIAWLYSQGFPKSMNPGRDQRFCQGCEVECDHAGTPQETTEHGLPGVHVGDVSQTEGVARGAGSVLLPSLPKQGAPTAGRAEPPAAEVWAGEPGMAGRGDHPQAEGELHRAALREMPGGPAVHGEVGRLHHGAPARDGSLDRATASPDGSGEPHQPRPTGQPTGEPGTVPQQRRSQAGRGGQVCAGCGKPPAPTGLGTALKPAFEPVVVARKPLAGTVAANVLQHGTGALNIDACRVPGEVSSGWYEAPGFKSSGGIMNKTDERAEPIAPHTAGRWPTNVVLDDSQAAALDEQSGESASKSGGRTTNALGAMNDDGWQAKDLPRTGHDDQGGASRFFPTFRYEAKAPASERPKVNGTAHPTVKPLDLMRWLVRLVTPPGGTVLEPFAGSGTTVEAAIVEGFHCIAIEREADYLPLITQRINRRLNPVEAVRQVGGDLGLFEMEGEGA